MRDTRRGRASSASFSEEIENGYDGLEPFADTIDAHRQANERLKR